MSKKIIFITGVTSGVGRETARRFIKEGWKVIGTGRRQSRLDELAAELGGDFLPLCFDVAKRDVVVEMFANLPEGFKDIDVLLNNAGSSIGQNPAQAGNMDDWDEMIATNINGLLYCTRCVLPGMIERGSGHIVNIGSVAGNRAFKCGNVYGATKAFVNHFSRMLRCDLLGTPVRVTNIKPGHLHTEFLAVRFKGDLKTSEAAYENLDPLTPENIAESVPQDQIPEGFTAVTIEIGIADEHNTEVISGLNEGDEVYMTSASQDDGMGGMMYGAAYPFGR